MKQCLERLYNGIIKENPTFVLMLGMCPTLAVTSSAINGFGMGISTMVVLAMSNLLIAMLRKIIPDKVRIPAFIVIVATFVTIVELLMHAFVPSLYKSLGIYISLIVVNCIILGRAEAYASKNKPLPSLFDGIGMGLGFTFALTIIGFVRELLGSGKVFGFSAEDMFGVSIAQSLANLATAIFPAGSKIGEFFAGELGSLSPIGILVMAPGAFFILALLTAIQNKIKMNLTAQGKDASKIQSGCNSDCMNCKDSGCTHREEKTVETKKVVEDEIHISDIAVEDLDNREVSDTIKIVDISEDETLESKPAEGKPARKRTTKPKAEVKEEIKEEIKEEPKAEEQPEEKKPARKRTTKPKTEVKEEIKEEIKEEPKSEEQPVEKKPARKRATKPKTEVKEEVKEVKKETKVKTKNEIREDQKSEEQPAEKKPTRKRTTKPKTETIAKEENADE